jgi:hypothetical protein
MNRVSIHLVEAFGARELARFKRDELQTFLDEKAQAGLSFSTVDHLRWDIKQIFDMAVSESRRSSLHTKGSGPRRAARHEHSGGANMLCSSRPA